MILPGKIFDSIIGYLQHPEIGRGRFESAIFTYLIVLALQGAFSRSAKAGAPSGHDPKLLQLFCLTSNCCCQLAPKLKVQILENLKTASLETRRLPQRRGGLKSLAQELVQRRMAMSVRMKLFASVIRMDIAFFDTMHTGQLTSRMTNDVSPLVPVQPWILIFTFWYMFNRWSRIFKNIRARSKTSLHGFSKTCVIELSDASKTWVSWAGVHILVIDACCRPRPEQFLDISCRKVTFWGSQVGQVLRKTDIDRLTPRPLHKSKFVVVWVVRKPTRKQTHAT